MAIPTDDTLNQAGYTDGKPVAVIVIEQGEINVQAFHPIQLDYNPALRFSYSPDEFIHHGARASKKYLFIPGMDRNSLAADAPLSFPTKLFLYAHQDNMDEAIECLKANYQRLALKRIAALKKKVSEEEVALGKLGL